MAENKEEESSKRVIYTYPMVKQTDMPDDMKVKLLEINTSISKIQDYSKVIYSCILPDYMAYEITKIF